MKEIKEFWDKYPTYKMGFSTVNTKTETEKLLGLSMSLCYDPMLKRTYQEFKIGDYMESLRRVFSDGKVHTITITINGGSIAFQGVLRANSVVGVCLNTMERIMFSESI